MPNKESEIHIDHNVYILGAGFSLEAGLPLISGFLNVMRDSLEWLSAQGRTDEVDSISEVFAFRLKAAATAYRTNINVENIEELFSLASAGDLALSRHIPRAIAATLDYARSMNGAEPVYATFANTFALPSPNWENTNKFASESLKQEYRAPRYDMYLAMMCGIIKTARSTNKRNTLVTFNYDTIVEDALISLNQPFDYGIEPGDIKSNAFAETEIGSQNLPLLKLHGSMNWGVNQVDDHVSIYKDYSHLRESGDLPLLVPPTWRKTFSGALTNVWEHTLKAISEATRIIIIGFSIPPTDVHFKYLLAAGLRDNISLKRIYFVNPHTGSINNLFQILRKDLYEQDIVRFANSNSRDFLFNRVALKEINRTDPSEGLIEGVLGNAEHFWRTDI